MAQESVGVVGAGLVGCLAALAFSAKGYKVHLFDLRRDPRLETSQRSLRLINLAVSDRGIRALQAVDEKMAERILQHVIPMKGRMIHDITGTKQESQIYGLFGESIKSIDRLFLNRQLLDELDNTDVEVLFEHKLTGVSDIDKLGAHPTLKFATSGSEEAVFNFDYVVGTDGAHSQFRYQMQKTMRMDFSQKYIDMQYMELSIPPVEGAAATSAGRFSLDPNHLHIWPRKDYMLIALANGDGSFTSTFFSPWEIIESIGSAEDFVAFFKQAFPDACGLIGEEGLRYAYDNQPRGSLVQVSASPYASPNNRAIILGDAAHSMVPFYGQGMNCGFEDVHVLMQLLEQSNGLLDAAFGKYTGARKADLDAICKLALDNYYEMSTKVTDPFYLLRKKVDYYLGKYANDVLFPWVPMYSMVSFRGDIRYSEAVAREQRQTRVLNWIQYVTLGGLAIYGAARAAQVLEKWRR
ncbi:kynurenine 3-monooxygenase [Metschnikowia bicuspidata var. bicuspidata NRRL YB-4993]|uniref:Kynurenine 3-monooxygenase n=1 Tax=Metschnikowia bicuspidata var. bicuspidata NRRL YB-4993 TaxID=869754 RepID=A0A1A0HK16_9ASCO|nr:kynurenine 3-monooxygenase [Metschnikowia bicuspidata var. bicuspidata NRRL YB-4993]OBA24365.1 kynurenine 3-monooxygenase [Metschnikowia bicuspidata var. bicuspidata NRRL YB-4993]